jgi:hypothetical protein
MPFMFLIIPIAAITESFEAFIGGTVGLASSILVIGSFGINEIVTIITIRGVIWYYK